MKETAVRSLSQDGYERLLAKSVSGESARETVREALADAISLRAAKERSQKGFEDVVAKIRVRGLARKIARDFENRSL
jgi:nicotinamidase-related amidase